MQQKQWKRTQIRCIETGEVYENLSTAAIAINCTKGAMSNHLAGRHPHIRGKRFERVLKTLILIALSATLTACATTVTYEPIVDFKKVDRNAYAVDLQECQRYAEKIENDALAAGIAMALLGAAAGAAVGDVYGDAGRGAAYGAVVIGGTGGAVQAGNVINRQETIVDNCLKGRGYKVLGK